MEYSSKDLTKQSYQITAEEFAKNVAALAPMESIEKFINLLPPKAKILDIGSGSGRDAKVFSDLGAQVEGVDFCENLLAIAKMQAPQSTFHLMNIETMEFPASTFDGVWAACSLVHISKSELPMVLKKIHLVLKDKGYFYLALKQGRGEKIEKDERYEGNIQKFWSYFEEEEIKAYLLAAKFTILECDIVEKSHEYQTHSAFRIFCQK